MTFKFRLSTVLKVREHERSIHRQSVAIARTEHTRRLAERDRIDEARDAILVELREINDSDAWQVEKVENRQRHAEQLSCDLETANTAVEHAINHLNQCLKSLIMANQSVQILERLAERQLADFDIHQAKVESREFDNCVTYARRVS